MPANPNLLPVSEAAREAAAQLAERFWDASLAADLRTGRFDEHPLVQAFAAFEQSKDAAFVAMLEGMKRDSLPGLNAVIDEAIANAKALGEGRAGS